MCQSACASVSGPGRPARRPDQRTRRAGDPFETLPQRLWPRAALVTHFTCDPTRSGFVRVALITDRIRGSRDWSSSISKTHNFVHEALTCVEAVD
jgi:hypothetical protein